MNVTVRCYGPAKDLVGADEVRVELAEPVTAADVLLVLAEEHERLRPILGTCALAVGDEIVGADGCIEPSLAHDVALLPPVAGG